MDKSAIEKLILDYRYSIIKNLLSKPESFWNTISDIKISTSCNKSYDVKIVYTHRTESYELNDYCLNEESESEEGSNPITKETRIEFGYCDGKFYINGKTPIHVYSKRDVPHIPYTYSSTYEHELDDCSQALLLDKYLDNKNIPEWLVIGFFKALKLKYVNINTIVEQLHFK